MSTVTDEMIEAGVEKLKEHEISAEMDGLATWDCVREVLNAALTLTSDKRAGRHDAAIAEYLLRLQAVEELTRDTRGRSNADGFAISLFIEKYDAAIARVEQLGNGFQEQINAVNTALAELRKQMATHRHPYRNNEISAGTGSAYLGPEDIFDPAPRNDDDTNFEQVGRLSPHASIPVTITVDQPARDDAGDAWEAREEAFAQEVAFIERSNAEAEAEEQRDDAAQDEGDDGSRTCREHNRRSRELVTVAADAAQGIEEASWNELGNMIREEGWQNRTEDWEALAQDVIAKAIGLGLVTAPEGEDVDLTVMSDMDARFIDGYVAGHKEGLRTAAYAVSQAGAPTLTPTADAEGDDGSRLCCEQNRLARELVTAPEGDADVRRRVIEELAMEAEGYFHSATYPSWLRSRITSTADAEGEVTHG